MPEFVYGEGKSPEQLALIMGAMVERTGRALATRVTTAHFEAVREVLPDVVHHPKARILVVNSFPKSEAGKALVIAAGTSDVPVAEEAAEVCGSWETRPKRCTTLGLLEFIVCWSTQTICRKPT